MSVRDMGGQDLGWVLALNKSFETELSPLSPATLGHLRDGAFAARVIDPGAAFMLGFDQDADYHSPNFLWFQARYPRFAYVDRICVSPDHRRQGHAASLYEDFFSLAKAAGHPVVACEVNSDPPNPGSDAFHEALGFRRVGEAHLGDHAKTVRYLVCELS